jgi:hypothetical protein
MLTDRDVFVVRAEGPVLDAPWVHQLEARFAQHGASEALYVLDAAGPWFNDGSFTQQFVNVLVTFNANGTTSVFGSDLDITWRINHDDELVLEYGDWRQEFIMLQRSGDVIKSVMVFQNMAHGDLFAYFDLAVERTAPFTATDWMTPAGMFWHAYTNGWSPGVWNDDGTPLWGFGALTFGWSFNGDGVAWNLQFFHDPWDYDDDFAPLPDAVPSQWHREMRWSMDGDGNLRFAGPMVNACYNVTPTVTCYYRRWIPLGKSASGTMHVIEETWRTDDDGGTWGLWIAPRVTPVRMIDIPASQKGVSIIRD